LWLYGTGPIALAILIFFFVFWVAFKLGFRRDTSAPLFGFLRRTWVARIALVVFALLAIAVANAAVDSWTVVRYFGGLRLPSTSAEYVDPTFGKALHFYFFALPFYKMLLRVVLIGAVLALIIYWLASNLETLGSRFANIQSGRFLIDREI
jgi:uncharacterized membrane protein (UPF0182 family)